MSDKAKNIITNIIGLVLLGFGGAILYFEKISFIEFVGIVVLSLGLFLFKGTVTKDYIKKFLDKKLSK